MRKLQITVLFVISAALLLTSRGALAQPNQHAAYLHALSDLREARAHLERPGNVRSKWDEHAAVNEIDAAIREIKGAAIDDGKPIHDHPPVDAKLEWGGRLQRSLQLVDKAYDDIRLHEDNAYARGLRDRAMKHLHDAAELIKQGIADASGGDTATGHHPAYLHALGDLRLARAMLMNRPGSVQVKWDERLAVREIEGAIREINTAAISDGKDLNAPVTIDTALDYGGRLRKSKELVEQAYEDIRQHEDNTYARGLRDRAMKHLHDAAEYIKQGLGAGNWGAGNGDGLQHPAYLHALSDLRLSRALLERPTANPRKAWDERKAIEEIDGAVREIKAASIDDGKPLNDHPPIDVKWRWGDRLQRAQEAVTRAYEDIRQHEDNAYARGLRDRAMKHCHDAVEYIKQGIAAKEY